VNASSAFERVALRGVRLPTFRESGVLMRGDGGGGIVVTEIARGVLECRAFGHVRLADVVAAQNDIDAMLARGGPFDAAIFDGRENVSFDPGLPVRWVRWAAARKYPFPRVAIVARPGPMTAVAWTMPYLVPSTRIRVFTSRDAAIAWVHGSVRRSDSTPDERARSNALGRE
jgi:hypothetical protein